MMQAFSISAPQLSEEEQQREKEALTLEEKLEIENDMNASARFMETPEMTTKGLMEFRQELDLIPNDKKSAYLQAMKRVPALVETETSPIKFLRCERFDAKTAALRCVQNWEIRLGLFGEKAFEPMTLEGALSNDEQVLNTGFFQCLRNDIPDKRAILIKDRPKLSTASVYDRESAIRVMWYMFHVASLNPFTQRNGAVLVYDAQQYGLEHFDRKLSRKMWQLLDQGTPFHLSAIHFCTAMSRSTYSIIIPAVLALMGKRNRLRMIHHGGPSHVEELMASGLTKDCISCELGGDVTMEMYKSWIQKRREIEQREKNAVSENDCNENL
jgi:hypothetical protein